MAAPPRQHLLSFEHPRAGRKQMGDSMPIQENKKSPAVPAVLLLSFLSLQAPKFLSKVLPLSVGAGRPAPFQGAG